MEEGIDFAKYIELLIRRWYLVILPSVICTVVVAAVILLLPKQYTAEAMVIAIRSIAQVSFNTAIKTSPQSSSQDAASTTTIASQRLVSLASLASSPSIAQAVLVSLGERLPAQERTVNSLFTMVQSEIVPKSDLIAIKVTHTDQQLALEIADVWAREYVRQVNTLYSSADTESYASIQREVPAAKANYEAAQAALEKWIKENRLSELVRRRDAIAATIAALNAARLGGAQAQLSDIQRTEVLLRAALDLRDQLKAGGPAAALSSSMALDSLKLKVFGELPPTQALLLTLQLQPSPAPVSSVEMISDTESLVAVLQARSQMLSNNLRKVADVVQQEQSWPLIPGTTDQQMTPEAQNTSLDQGLDQVLISLESQFNKLDTTIEQANSQFKQATAERDLAWETYSNLVRKEAELKLTVATAGAEVRLGTPPVALLVVNHLIKNLGIAAFAGLMLGIFCAFALEFWLGYRARRNAGTGGTEAKPAAQ